ncbi:hypothetical protein [Bacillus sp. REN16]|uniref:hypothetical protein n=1 Tax=Bacillus sp. REN16 TaxID=2887296 RepID=UPI001E4F5CA0|nr:hypothetical protein [Bacillus sp. REN16]MCC3355422.1 hypothetical protein [Bacillus sp. REN16]
MVKVLLLFFLFFFSIEYLNVEATTEFDEKDSPLSFKVELVPWEMVNEILPRKSFFTIIDVETGLQFRVQRRAGSRHADVQPLTIDDTKIMKKIYGGKWSWKRRAIIVKYGDQMIAASMHGMPHGGGALKNGFPGHFCVHFLGSTTHRSKEPDLAHKLMLLKAGGKLDEYISNADPYQLIEIFATGVNQTDQKIIKQTFLPNAKNKKLFKNLNQITIFSITNISYLPLSDLKGLLSMEIPVEVEIFRDQGKERIQIVFVLVRNSIVDRWYIQQNELHKQL